MSDDNFRRQNAAFRLIMLLCFFASSAGDVFNSVFIRRMLMTTDGGSGEFMIGLPLTLCSAMMALGVLISGRLIGRKKSFASYLRVSILTLLAGLILKSISVQYSILVLGFSVSGFGTGLLFISIRYYAFLFPDEKQRTRALTYVNGGAFVGQCLGTILGGILAGQIEYRYIYFLSAVFLILPLLFLKWVQVEETAEANKTSEMQLIIKNPKVLLFLLGILVPIYACSVFLSYTVPLYVEDFGFSSNITSVLLLGNYLLSAYAAPFFTDLVSAHMSAMKSTLIYMLLTASMIILYVMFPSIIMLAAVVIVCGLLDSFGLTVVMNAFINTLENEKYSMHNALIVFILMSRIGQTVGSGLIAATNSILILSIMLVLGMGIYLIVNNGRSQK